MNARFNAIEKKEWDFKDLNKVSTQKNPHHVWTIDEINMFFDKIQDKRIDMVVAVHILWDMASRPKDVLALTYEGI